MKSLKIISKTEIGEKAMQIHYDDVMKLNRVKKFALKQTGYNHTLTGKQPSILLIWASPNSAFSLVKPKHLKEEIDEAMVLNGAKVNIDYYYEEEESKKETLGIPTIITYKV